MSAARLRKLIVLGAAWVIHGDDAQFAPAGRQQKYETNRAFILGTNADRYVRLWAPWNQIFPNAAGIDGSGTLIPGLGPGEGVNASGLAPLQRLDEEIAWACRDGVNVILTPYQFPWWSNGTAGINANTEQDYRHQPYDRTSQIAWTNDILNAGFPSSLRPGVVWKPLQFKLPTGGFGVDSQWGRWINWLYQRYSPTNPGRPRINVGGTWTYATLHGLEVSNEPNGQLWPQRTAPAVTDPVDPRLVHVRLGRLRGVCHGADDGNGLFDRRVLWQPRDALWAWNRRHRDLDVWAADHQVRRVH